MFIRRNPNKSGSFSVQVVAKRHSLYVVVRTFGASKDKQEIVRMENEAAEFSSRYGGQGVIDSSDGVTTPDEELTKLKNSINAAVMNGPHLILDRVYDNIGFNAIHDQVLRNRLKYVVILCIFIKIVAFAKYNLHIYKRFMTMEVTIV